MVLLTKIFGVLVGLIVVVVGAGLVLPSTVHVEREIVINAQPDDVFALISDFNEWDAWSPWAKLDPDADMTIEGGAGIGQTMSWSSENPQVGSGSQEIVAMDAPNSLKTYLDLGEMGVADASFALIPENDGTRVVWSLDTDSRERVPLVKQPISTYFGFFMDAMLGGDYETGLQNLKSLAES
ncbi:MAG: SRPBCC family protein [Cyanobacteria bacterium P01_E01_bin.6]